MEFVTAGAPVVMGILFGLLTLAGVGFITMMFLDVFFGIDAPDNLWWAVPIGLITIIVALILCYAVGWMVGLPGPAEAF